MAWESIDLAARVRRYTNRPATDESFPDPDLYAFLTEAEAHWKPVLATHYPGPMYNAPTLLTSSDDGLTYDFPGGITPMGQVELYLTPRGDPLYPSFYGDPGGDFVMEGNKIRMTRARARTFSDGPYARWVDPPGTIDAVTDSTILPAENRILLVFDCLERWAIRTGARDPTWFRQQLQKAWAGDPATPGDVGILGWLKNQVFNAGEAAIQQPGPYPWWHAPGLFKAV